jgi:hypothetical protein
MPFGRTLASLTNKLGVATHRVTPDFEMTEVMILQVNFVPKGADFRRLHSGLKCGKNGRRLGQCQADHIKK